MQLLLLHLDDALELQPDFMRSCLTAGAHEIHASDDGQAIRLWSKEQDFEAFAGRLTRQMPRMQQDALLCFIGSGDFHHATSLLLETALQDEEESVTIVHFDNHPDWTWTLPRRHCGSWVNEVLALPNVERVVTIGPCSDDLMRPDRKGANLAPLSSGRLELFPWRREPSEIRKAISSGAGHVAANGVIRWRNLIDEDWSSFLCDLKERAPTQRIWITIDKDVLPPTEAVTNWDQGGLPLQRLIEAIQRLAASFTIVGADICGEYAPIRHRNPFKIIESRLDQPRVGQAPDLSVNARTNERLMAAFEAVL